MTATEPVPSPDATDTWTAQLEQLRARYKHVSEPILVALHILSHNPDVALDDAKAQAALHGVRITAASVAAARRLLSRRDPSPTSEAPKQQPRSATRPRRRPRAARAPLDVETLIRATAVKIEEQGAAEADRLREAMRKAIAVLEAALGD